MDISFKTDSCKNKYATKTYNDQNYINVEGGTLRDDLNVNNNKVTKVGSPTENSDCATKKYVDNLGVRRNSENDIIMETLGKFIIKTLSLIVLIQILSSFISAKMKFAVIPINRFIGAYK